MFTTDGNQAPHAYLFETLRVKLGDHSSICARVPGTKGAFVNCVIAAISPSEATDLLTKALISEGCQLLDFEMLVDLGNYHRWNYENIPEEIFLLAQETLTTRAPAFGTFHAW